jgi:hypothetical protein
MDQSNVMSMKLSKSKNEQVITISYFVPELNRNRTEEITEVPHQDFNAALLNLSPFLSSVFHSDDENYVATGFKYTSDNKVVITGKLSTVSGSIVGIATPAINTDEDIYGFEEDFSEALSTLVFETHQLLTGKKVGIKQLTIDDAIKDNEGDTNEESTTMNEETILDTFNEPPENDEFTLPE